LTENSIHYSGCCRFSIHRFFEKKLLKYIIIVSANGFLLSPLEGIPEMAAAQTLRKVRYNRWSGTGEGSQRIASVLKKEGEQESFTEGIQAVVLDSVADVIL
jgi:hypothetical protein